MASDQPRVTPRPSYGTVLGDRPDESADDYVPSFAELDARVVGTGAVLFIMAYAFFFGGWFFAFAYLKALNANHMWMPSWVHVPSRGLGFAIVALMVISAAVYWVGARLPTRTVRNTVGGISFVIGAIGVLLGIRLLWNLGFGASSGGYAAMFFGLWGSVLVLFGGALLWQLGILIQGGPTGDTTLRPASSAAFSNIFAFFALGAVVTYIVLFYAA